MSGLHKIFKFVSVAPRIDRRNLRDVTISAGSALKFDANIIGEPPPTVEWRYGALPLRYIKMTYSRLHFL
jgi:hypothetical protein